MSWVVCRSCRHVLKVGESSVVLQMTLGHYGETQGAVITEDGMRIHRCEHSTYDRSQTNTSTA